MIVHGLQGKLVHRHQKSTLYSSLTGKEVYMDYSEGMLDIKEDEGLLLTLTIYELIVH